MPTKQELISDVILRLTQGSPSDDLELEPAQVGFWLSLNYNAIVASEINQKTNRGEMTPAIYVRRAECQVPELDDTECSDECNDRIFIELDDEVMTLNNDAGIILVQTSEGDTVYKASVESLSLFKHMRFAAPSENNLLYYRQNKRIYVEGIKPVDIPFDKFHVWYVPQIDINSLSNGDEVPISDLSAPILIDAATQTGKLQMYGSQSDDNNNALQEQDPIYHTRIANAATPPPEQQ